MAALRGGAVVLAATAASCAPSRATPVAAPAAPPAPSTVAATTAAAAAAQELPQGKGKQALLAACTLCHDLGEVTKFRGYYNRAQWRDIVVTMMDYGAPVQKSDIEELADYLNEHLGRRVTSSIP